MWLLLPVDHGTLQLGRKPSAPGGIRLLYIERLRRHKLDDDGKQDWIIAEGTTTGRLWAISDGIATYVFVKLILNSKKVYIMPGNSVADPELKRDVELDLERVSGALGIFFVVDGFDLNGCNYQVIHFVSILKHWWTLKSSLATQTSDCKFYAWCTNDYKVCVHNLGPKECGVLPGYILSMYHAHSNFVYHNFTITIVPVARVSIFTIAVSTTIPVARYPSPPSPSSLPPSPPPRSLGSPSPPSLPPPPSQSLWYLSPYFKPH